MGQQQSSTCYFYILLEYLQQNDTKVELAEECLNGQNTPADIVKISARW